MKTLIAAALAETVVLLAGCTHTPPTLIQPPSYAGQQLASAGAAADAGIVCTREIPTGLRVSVTKCREHTEVDKRRALDQDWAKSIPAELPKER